MNFSFHLEKIQFRDKDLKRPASERSRTQASSPSLNQKDSNAAQIKQLSSVYYSPIYVVSGENNGLFEVGFRLIKIL